MFFAIANRAHDLVPLACDPQAGFTDMGFGHGHFGLIVFTTGHIS
jgi:hypothetical protein